MVSDGAEIIAIRRMRGQYVKAEILALDGTTSFHRIWINGDRRALLQRLFLCDPLILEEGKEARRDPATGAVVSPKYLGETRGRKPKGERPMSSAERSRLCRARKAGHEPPAAPTVPQWPDVGGRVMTASERSRLHRARRALDKGNDDGPGKV